MSSNNNSWQPPPELTQNSITCCPKLDTYFYDIQTHTNIFHVYIFFIHFQSALKNRPFWQSSIFFKVRKAGPKNNALWTKIYIFSKPDYYK